MTQCISNAYPADGLEAPRPEVAAKALLETVAGHAASALATLRTWNERAAQRRQLREMDDRILKDIGLSRLDVYRETIKPFWRP